MKLDFSKYGSKAGIIKGLKVLGYYVVTGIVVGLGVLISNQQPSATEYIILYAIVNSIIAGLQRWLSSHNPTGIS